MVLERKRKTGRTYNVKNEEVLQIVKRMANSFGHTLRRSCLLRRVFEGKIEVKDRSDVRRERSH